MNRGIKDTEFIAAFSSFIFFLLCFNTARLVMKLYKKSSPNSGTCKITPGFFLCIVSDLRPSTPVF